MPGANGDDEMADGFETTNWTARAKGMMMTLMAFPMVHTDRL